MDKDIIRAAENYSKLKAYSESLWGKTDHRSTSDKVSDFIASFAVGTVKVIINLIKRLLIFVRDCVKWLIMDSGLLKTLMKGLLHLVNLGDVARGEAAIYNSIKYIDDPQEINSYLERIKTVVDNKIKTLKKYRYSSYIMDKFNAIIDPEITDNGNIFKTSKIEQMVYDNSLYEDCLRNLRLDYENYFNHTDPSVWEVKKTIDCSDNVTRGQIIVAYKDLLDKFIKQYEVTESYFKDLDKVVDSINKYTSRLNTDNMTGQVDIFYMNIVNDLVLLVTRDVKIIADMHKWVKNEIVSNLLILTK